MKPPYHARANRLLLCRQAKESSHSIFATAYATAYATGVNPACADVNSTHLHMLRADLDDFASAVVVGMWKDGDPPQWLTLTQPKIVEQWIHSRLARPPKPACPYQSYVFF